MSVKILWTGRYERNGFVPSYKYTAKDLSGKTHQGQVDADNVLQLSVKLRDQKLFLLNYKEAKKSVTPASQKLKATEIADFCRQIGTMLGSGVALTRAVSIIMQRDLDPRVRNVYTQLSRSLQQGNSLSVAMKEQGETFPELLIHMFYAGESSGQLDHTAIKMANHYEKEHRLRLKIKNSMTYPTLLLFVTIGVMIIIFTFVLPEIFVVFEDMDLDLPFTTRAIMAISNGLLENWLWVLIIIVAIIGVISALSKMDSVRMSVDKTKLKLPKIGKLLKIIYTARFSRTLSSLYSSGLPIIRALQISRETVGNRYVSSLFDDVITAVRNGGVLSQAIKKINVFDGKLASTVLIGEETGKLDEMLNSVADAFDYEAEMATQRLTAFIEPLLILIMAGLVGTVMISVMMPIYQLYQGIG
jgi:type IV pilus assembly protein PilC